MGPVRLHVDRRRVHVDDHEVVLTATEFALLTHLMRAPARVFTREQLLGAVWGYGGGRHPHGRRPRRPAPGQARGREPDPYGARHRLRRGVVVTGAAGPPRWVPPPRPSAGPRRCSRPDRATSWAARRRALAAGGPAARPAVPPLGRRQPVRGRHPDRVDGRPAQAGGHRGRGRRTSLAVRVTAACLLVAVVAVGAAGLVAVRLVAVTARTVTQEVLAQQADVVAAQLAETGGGLRAGAGMRRVVDVLAGQGVTVVVVTARGPRNAGILAPVLEEAEVRRVLDGQPVSAQATSAGVHYLVEARPAPVGGFALVRTTETGPLGGGLVRRNLTIALLAGVAVAVVVGLVVGQLLARTLRRTAIAARLLRSGRRDVRVPVAGPAEVSDVAGAVNELADALARSEERQRRFLLSVSHELRTPLTAVRGFAESLADGVVTGPDAADAGRVIVREADRLDRLVGDLMELARLEADDFRLDPVPRSTWPRSRPTRLLCGRRGAPTPTSGSSCRPDRPAGPGRPPAAAAGRRRAARERAARRPAGRVARARDRRRRRRIMAPGPGRWSRPVARGLPGRLRPRSACTTATEGGARWAPVAWASHSCTGW